MKSKKVLLGLFVGVLSLAGSFASAQTTGTKFYEMGPVNISGRISSLVVDQRDASHTTLFAGAASGGLFLHSEDTNILRTLYTAQGGNLAIAQNTEIWHYVRYENANQREEILPISCMAQGPDNTLYIGTGDSKYQIGSHYSAMSTLGKGLFRYNPATSEFTVVSSTVPTALDSRFAAINDVQVVSNGGTLYVYVACDKGLFRWTINSESDWDNASSCKAVFEDGAVSQIVIAPLRDVAYFAAGNQVYRIGNIYATNVAYSNLSSGNQAFGGHNVAVHLTVAPSDNRYVYAMVIASTGALENVYLTTNDMDWLRVTTSTVAPFTSNSGKVCGAMIVDPNNPKHIYIAGSSIWSGQGYVDNQAFMWITNSTPETTLMSVYSDYMSTVFNNAMFVHSGIHQMVCVPGEEGGYNYYIATDGGIHVASTTAERPNISTFRSLNRGLNTVQINSVAVSPDGALISGANNNACPFIEPRMAHYGGTPDVTWYDDGSLGNLNHDANIIFSGNGAQVTASAFQQLQPQTRRTVFVTSQNNIGRAYADYLDYSQTQTWTVGGDFMADEYSGGPAMKQVYLWENDNDSVFKDSVKVVLDTLGYIKNTEGEMVPIGSADFLVQPGYTGTFLSRGHAEYPFEYTFKASDTIVYDYINRIDTIHPAPGRTERDSIVNVTDTVERHRMAKDSILVKNPLVSRMLTIGNLGDNQTALFYTWRATDFTKVYSAEVARTDYSKVMSWPYIYYINRGVSTNRNIFIRTAAISQDGRNIFVVDVDTLTHSSRLLRINNLEKVNYNAEGNGTFVALKYNQPLNELGPMDTLEYYVGADTLKWIPRIVSSIAIDPRKDANQLVLTFEGYDDDFANVAVVTNLKGKMELKQVPLANANIPAFCAMVDKKEGKVYVGTTDGVYVQDKNVFNGRTNWSEYTNMPKIAVTSMCQQTREMPVRRLTGHNGINAINYVFSKSKWPYAIYFGTYGRGIFMDMSLVTDTVNEASDSIDYASIPTVNSIGANSVSVYPNPVAGEAHLALTATEAGNAVMQIFDLNGRRIMTQRLGAVNEGETEFVFDCSYLPKGMYLINITVGSQTAATKMMVR